MERHLLSAQRTDLLRQLGEAVYALHARGAAVPASLVGLCADLDAVARQLAAADQAPTPEEGLAAVHVEPSPPLPVSDGAPTQVSRVPPSPPPIAAAGQPCPQCGAPNSGGAFCTRCGTRYGGAPALPTQPPQQRRCPSCHTPVIEPGHFCVQCGARLINHALRTVR